MAHLKHLGMDYRKIAVTVKNKLFSPRGKNMLVFCAFILIAAVLWVVMTLNEEVQKDIRATVHITNVPDSVKLVSFLPEAVNISVKATGNELFAYDMGKRAIIDVDYRYYSRGGGRINLAPTEMRGLTRRMFGQNTQVLAMNPDTLNLLFTSRRPVRLPVRVDAAITTLPNCALTHPVRSSVDSVLVYSVNPLPDSYLSVPTQHIKLGDIAQSERVRVKLVTPPGARAYPDSVDLIVSVEPMISRTARVPVRVENVPQGISLILLPAQVTLNYTLPMSRYDDTKPVFDVVADFNTLQSDFSSNRIKVELRRAEGNFLEVYMSHDSVDYIIERK